MKRQLLSAWFVCLCLPLFGISDAELAEELTEILALYETGLADLETGLTKLETGQEELKMGLSESETELDRLKTALKTLEKEHAAFVGQMTDLERLLSDYKTINDWLWVGFSAAAVIALAAVLFF